MSDAVLSGDYTDDIIEFTDNGRRRAVSEARRAWNFVCDAAGCGQRFNRPCRLEAHRRTHTKERPFVCSHNGCDKSFPRKDHLQRHEKAAHTGAAEHDFVCDWEGCNKTFTSAGRLKRHKDVHASKLYCTGYPPCHEAFRKEKTLQAHVKSQHLEVKPYPCTYVDEKSGDRCTSGYQTDVSLRRHMESAHCAVVKEEIIRCMTCVPPGSEVDTITNASGDIVQVPKDPLIFASHEELSVHLREAHPPTCFECGIKFKRQSSLQCHLKAAHGNPEDQPRYPCPKPDCDSVFNRRNNLNVHIQSVHEKLVKFHCTSDGLATSKHPDVKDWDGENSCGAPFKSKSALEQHIRTHHLGLDNRRLTRLKEKKSRKRHAEPSTLSLLTGIGYGGDRDIACLVDGCEYRFYRKCDLRRHLRSAIHRIFDDDVDAMMEGEEAASGGQFWIGGVGVDEPLFESADPSVPASPASYFMDSGLPASPLDGAVYLKQGDVRPPAFGQMMDFAGLDDGNAQMDSAGLDDGDVEMDRAMGLDAFPPAVDVQDGLLWDLLQPVEQQNWDFGD
ncbi:hypothetical protein BDV95DRAFT_581190 [Massariosphaeria phaeospora]|uniref:C2H2-type domain-containing protein n=1 Tax=Massariosphaeria phaeospora TaxID=100035 RepID=A0A7C8MFC6_9PLEO|nr:hypothetical protein BDV95DRAFT_581190 [Massariosphaeria phaeospora]